MAGIRKMTDIRISQRMKVVSATPDGLTLVVVSRLGISCHTAPLRFVHSSLFAPPIARFANLVN